MNIRRITITDTEDGWFSQGETEGIDQEQSIANARQVIVDAVQTRFPDATVEIVSGGAFNVSWESGDGQTWSYRASSGADDPSPVSDVISHVMSGIWRQSAQWLVMEERAS